MSILICTIPNLFTKNTYIEASETILDSYYAEEISKEEREVSLRRLENYLLSKYLNQSSSTYFKTFKKHYLKKIKKKDISYMEFISEPELKAIRKKTQADYTSYRKLVLRLLIPKIYQRINEILEHQVVILASTLYVEAFFMLFKQSYTYGEDILPLHYKRIDIKNKIIKRYKDIIKRQDNYDEVLNISTGELIKQPKKELLLLDNVKVDRISKLKHRYLSILPMWDLSNKYYSFYKSSYEHLVREEEKYFSKKEKGVIVKKPSTFDKYRFPSLLLKEIGRDNNYDIWFIKDE